MKKQIKALVIAASVAAIAGIGAVSFAAWSGTSTTANVTTPNTGSVTLNGLAGELTPEVSGKGLVPLDQASGDGYVAANMSRWYDYKLTVTASDTKDIYMTITSSVAGKLYWIANATQSETQKTAVGDYTGTALTTGVGVKILENVSAGDYYVRLVLKSDATDTTATGEMNQTVAAEFAFTTTNPHPAA